MKRVEEKQYLSELRHIMEKGNEDEKSGKTRTNVWAKRMFHTDMSFDLSGNKIPVLNTKKMSEKSALGEALWILQGHTDLASLNLYGCRYWNDWGLKTFNECLQLAGTEEEDLCRPKEYADLIDDVYFNGKQPANPIIKKFLEDCIELGPFYGKQLRDWDNYVKSGIFSGCEIYKKEFSGIDQLRKVVKGIMENPLGRRHVLSLWNLEDLDDAALNPCAFMYQFYVENGDELQVKMHMRSADMFLGVPYNIITGSLYAHIIAEMCGLKATKLHVDVGNAHIYNNHFDAVEEQIKRVPENTECVIENLSELKLQEAGVLALDGLKPKDFKISSPEMQPAIKADVAV